MLIDHHHLDVQWVYDNDHLRRCIWERISEQKWPDVFFGHYVHDIAGVVKAFMPTALEIAFYRNPDEIVRSDWLKCRSTDKDSCYDIAMAAQSPEEFGKLYDRANPIQQDLSGRIPDRWFSFYDMRNSYLEFCQLFGLEPLESVLADIVQAPPKPEPYPRLNTSDFEFLQKHHLILPY